LDASRLGVPQARERLIISGFREDLGVDPALGFPQALPHRTTVNDALPHVGHFGPARTVTTGGLHGAKYKIREDGVLHTRDLRIEELKRLCSFPDDFRMEGPLTQQKRRLGNAVPPLMARAWAERIGAALTTSALQASVPTALDSRD
jgi:site-specific DNA-cytosine methylase